jgi:hypothetical protein
MNVYNYEKYWPFTIATSHLQTEDEQMQKKCNQIKQKSQFVEMEKHKIFSYVNARCNLWITFSTCYQTLIQLMLNVNSWINFF